MKKLISIFLILIFTTFILVSCSSKSNNENSHPQSVENIKKSGKLTLYTSANFPPFEYLNGTDIVGVDIDIANEIAKDLGVELVAESVAFDSILTGMQTNKAAIALSGISVTPERAEKVSFSTPYVDSIQKFIIPVDSNLKTVEDLAGKNIGVATGTTGDIILQEEIEDGVLKDKGTNVYQYKTSLDAAMDIASGRIDAVIVDENPAERISAKTEGTKTTPVVFENGDTPREQYAAVISKDNPSLLEAVNRTIERLQKEGKIEEFIVSHTDPSSSKSNPKGYLNLFLKGLGNTLIIAFFAILIGAFIGILLAIIKVYCQQSGKFKPLNWLINIYITIIRGTPVVIQLLIAYYLIAAGPKSNALIVAIITFGINSGAYVCETVRAGITAIDKGQTEAGRCLGLNQTQTMFKIVLPQAFKNILPALGNELVTLVKETSIAGYIPLIDLTKAGDMIRASSFETLYSLSAVALTYLVLVTGLSGLVKLVERRLAKSDKS